MKKLTIDISSCMSCPYRSVYLCGFCSGLGHRVDTEERFPEWCPLENRAALMNDSAYMIKRGDKKMYKPGDQIAYIPDYTKDTEFGFVTSVGDGGYVFCRYWREPGILKTVNCSQRTYEGDLSHYKSVDQSVVNILMKELGYDKT